MIARQFPSSISLRSALAVWDPLFLIAIPKFSDRVAMPCTHGNTREEAAGNAREIREMYLEASQEEGESLSEPDSIALFRF